MTSFTLSPNTINHLNMHLMHIELFNTSFHYRLTTRPLEHKPFIQVVIPYDSIKSLDDNPKSCIEIFHEHFKKLKLALQNTHPDSINQYTEYVCYIVIEDTKIASESLACLIAIDAYCVLKNVVSLNSLANTLQGVFPSENNADAYELPAIYITKEISYLNPPKENFAEKALSVYPNLKTLLSSITEDKSQVLTLAATLANQISGGIFFMSFNIDEDNITWSHGIDGYPEEYDVSSPATRTLLSICVGLANSALATNKPNAITIPPVFGVFDTLRQLRLYGALKEFVNSTKIGLYVIVVSDSQKDALIRHFAHYKNMTYNHSSY